MAKGEEADLFHAAQSNLDHAASLQRGPLSSADPLL
jgi:hypothetical protein